jgi:hypothetical protein
MSFVWGHKRNSTFPERLSFAALDMFELLPAAQTRITFVPTDRNTHYLYNGKTGLALALVQYDEELALAYSEADHVIVYRVLNQDA